MVWLHLQSGPIKQAKVMIYYNHFTDEKIVVQGCWATALTLIIQPYESWSKTGVASPACPALVSFSKPPLTPGIYRVPGTISGAGKGQSYNRSFSVLTPSRIHHHS